MKSESQHGSSWVNKFHKTMEDWFLVHHYATRRILTLLWIQSMVLQQKALDEREVSAQDDAPMSNPYEQPSRRGRSQE